MKYIPDILSSSRIPKEDCPLNDEYILSIFVLFLLLDISKIDFLTKSMSFNSSEKVELNVSLLLLFFKILKNINKKLK